MEDDRWEWVKEAETGKRRKAHWRRRPRHRDNPTLPMRKVQYTVARVMHEAAGTRGKFTYKDKEIPKVLKPLIMEMKGKKFAPPKLKKVPPILEKFTYLFEEVGKQVEGMRPLRKMVPRLILMQREMERKKLIEKAKEV